MLSFWTCMWFLVEFSCTLIQYCLVKYLTQNVFTSVHQTTPSEHIYSAGHLGWERYGSVANQRWFDVTAPLFQISIMVFHMLLLEFMWRYEDFVCSYNYREADWRARIQYLHSAYILGEVLIFLLYSHKAWLTCALSSLPGWPVLTLRLMSSHYTALSLLSNALPNSRSVNHTIRYWTCCFLSLSFHFPQFLPNRDQNRRSSQVLYPVVCHISSKPLPHKKRHPFA